MRVRCLKLFLSLSMAGIYFFFRPTFYIEPSLSSMRKWFLSKLSIGYIAFPEVQGTGLHRQKGKNFLRFTLEGAD